MPGNRIARRQDRRRIWIGLVAVALLAACGACAKKSSMVEAPPPDVPQFPWPPPAASATVDLTRPLLERHMTFTTLGDADSVLQAALRQTGYIDTSYYWIPGGFALVTKLEHIDANGASRPEDDRWSVEPAKLTRLSLRDYLRALFTANAGHYRFLVFTITDVAVTQTERHITEAEALAWLRGGRRGLLPSTIATRPWTPEVTCTALIYEFVHEQQQDPQIVFSNALGGMTHLTRAGTRNQQPKLWGALGFAMNNGG